MDWVWNHSRAKGVGRLVMLALADKALPASDDCKAYGSLSFLQQRANCTREAVTDALVALRKLGELEPVEGEKGPYGAAVYRLPKAIGHTRPESNRSAHPTDSGSTIGRLTRPPVVGSPDQSEPQSVGSPDHNTTPPPRTTTSAAPATPGGGGGNAALQDAETFLGQLPGRWRCGRTTAAKLAPLLLEAIEAQGWDLDDTLAGELTQERGPVKTYPGALQFRIGDLPKKPSASIRASPGPRTSIVTADSSRRDTECRSCDRPIKPGTPNRLCRECAAQAA